MPHSTKNPFAKKQSSLEKKEKTLFSLFAFCTYFIIICASCIFLNIIWNGTPVLMQKGLSFITQKPETLAVLEMAKSDKYQVPSENFNNLLKSNPQEIPIKSLSVSEKQFQFVSFKIKQGSIIGDGYLLNIEKDNPGTHIKFTERKSPKLLGFNLENDKQFTLSKKELSSIQKNDPQLIQSEITEKKLSLNNKKVTIKAGEYPISKEAHDSLLKSDLIFQMKQSFPDDEPDKINLTVIPHDQTITVSSSVFYSAFDDEDASSPLPTTSIENSPFQKTITTFSLPKAHYKVSPETLKILSNHGIKHLHNTDLGSIVINEEIKASLTLDKKAYTQLIKDNPNLVTSDTKEHQESLSYTNFSIEKDCEVQLNASDLDIFSKNPNFKPSSKKTHSYSGGGILGPIIGTACLVIICMVIALFTGIAAATYLNEYARKGTFTKTIRLAMLNLAGVPSIVFGLFGLGLFVMLAPVFSNTPKVESKLHIPIISLGSPPELRTMEAEGIVAVDPDLSTSQAVATASTQGAKKFHNGYYYISFQGWGTCMLAGGFTLAIMVLPVIITSCEESLKAVPMGFREASMALGATKWQSIRTAVLPYAFSGILTASILGITRVAGETAPIMFTAAVAEKSDLPWQGIHSSGFSAFIDFLQQSVQALPYHIFTVAGRIPQSEYTRPMQYGSVLVFMIIVLLLSAVSIYLRNKVRGKIKW